MKTPWEYAPNVPATLEHAHQVALLMWAAMACRFGINAADDPKSYAVPGYAQRHGSEPLPQLKWLHAIHNQGHGDVVRGGRAKAEGVKAGVADLFLPVPISRRFSSANVRAHECGLYIEMKRLKGEPSDIQVIFAHDMQEAGYTVAFAYGWLQAKQHVLFYLDLLQ